MASLAGTLLDNDAYEFLVKDQLTVHKPNGELLFIYLPHVISPYIAARAIVSLRLAAKTTNNRGSAAGPRHYPVKKNGTRSRTDTSPSVQSGVVGFLDRNSRFPYCRMTEFGHDNPIGLAAVMPILQQLDDYFRAFVPERWMAQMKACDATDADWVFPHTPFTTVTVNRNFQTAVHKDVGDLKEGFGVMTAFGHGYRGGYLCFPEYGVAVDMREGGVLFADVHEWHGNTPIVPFTPTWERLSLVCYYREHMKDCGSAEEELRRAKGRVKGDPIRGK